MRWPEHQLTPSGYASTARAVVVSCHRLEALSAKCSWSYIFHMLNSPLSIVHSRRKNLCAALEGISGANKGQKSWWGRRIRTLHAFAGLPCSATFVACSARGSGSEEASNQADIQEVKDWIAQLA